MHRLPEQTPDAHAAPDISIAGCRLLLVEDNALNAEIAQILLTDEGATVTVVTDGKQAVEIVQNNPPDTFDAVLMDVMMPVMNGIDAAKTIRSLNRPDAKTLPIIAMTANAFLRGCTEVPRRRHECPSGKAAADKEGQADDRRMGEK